MTLLASVVTWPRLFPSQQSWKHADNTGQAGPAISPLVSSNRESPALRVSPYIRTTGMSNVSLKTRVATERHWGLLAGQTGQFSLLLFCQEQGNEWMLFIIGAAQNLEGSP